MGFTVHPRMREHLTLNNYLLLTVVLLCSCSLSNSLRVALHNVMSISYGPGSLYMFLSLASVATPYICTKIQ
jgi:hypothetical protein